MMRFPSTGSVFEIGLNSSSSLETPCVASHATREGFPAWVGSRGLHLRETPSAGAPWIGAEGPAEASDQAHTVEARKVASLTVQSFARSAGP